MKKISLFLLMIPLVLSASAQSLKKTIEEKRIGSITSKYYMEINGSDTTINLFCSFQNRKYQHVTDIGSVYFFNLSDSRKEVAEFVKDLESCIPYVEEGGTTYRKGKLVVYDFSSQIFVNDGRKYTTITKRQLKKWVKWLNEVVIGIEVE